MGLPLSSRGLASLRHALVRAAAPAVAVCAALALPGCAGLVPTRAATPPAVAVPAAWLNADASPQDAIASDWWRRFGDVQLDALVARALQANADLRSAQASLRQARALVDVQAAGLAPQLNASASAQRNRSRSGTANAFNAGLDASWEADLFGSQRAGIDAARADALASAATLGDAQVSLAAEVALAYQQWAGTRARLAVARENLAIQLETLQITQWRTQAGLTTSLELEQARTAAEQTRAQIPALESTLAQSVHGLAVLTGRPPAVLPELQASTATQAPVAPEQLALSIPADTLRQRPDVRRAEAQLRAAAARAQQAQADRLPSLRLSGNVGLSALTLGTLGASGSGVAGLLAAVTLPVFDGGALRARGEAQDAALDGARAGYEATVLGALKDVEDALVALKSAQERRLTLQRAAESAGNAALIARQRYGSGLIDFQVVLDTQRTQLNAQDGLAAAQTDLATAQVRLVKALGGGWRYDEAAALNPPTP
jgi:NodT family efflux transporter outer membrane factor (OMF) lipoprotein